VQGFELPHPLLQEKTLGLRKGEITLLTAGSGIGKSTLARELAYHLHQSHGCKIGNVFLEENNTKTAQGYVAIHNSVPLGKLRYDPDVITTEQWNDALQNVIRKRMWFYDHFGSLESKNLQAKLRYFANVLKVDFIVLDHISIVVSGVESGKEGERKDIDMLMTRLRSLVEETGIGIIAIVHLKRTGKNFNEGGQVSLSDLRGSASLEQLSDNVLALERNQQDPENATKMLLRILKCRELGETGEADMLNYDRKTGRITLAASDQFPEDDVQPAETL
jgi:twinkle protein